MAKKKQTADNELLQALRFISVAQKDIGQPMETHCLIGNGFAQAFDGTIAAGYPVPDHFGVALHTRLMIAALKRANGPCTFTQTSASLFTFRMDGFLGGMGRFQAHIPTLDAAALVLSLPDAILCPCDDRIRVAFAVLAPFGADRAEKIPACSMLSSYAALAATNLNVMVEYYHGIDLPQGLVIPHQFATAILNTDLSIVGFGMSDRSITLHFENGAWIRTQLYPAEEQGKRTWPNYAALFEQEKPTAALQPIPDGMWESLDAVKPHCEHNALYILQGKIASSPKFDIKGAVIELPGLPEAGLQIGIRDFELMRPHAKQMEFKKNGILFFGNNMRAFMVAGTIRNA